MHKKLLLILVLTLINPSYELFANDSESELFIVPRVSWGANSLYNDVNSDYWKAILKSRAEYIAPYKSPETIEKQQEKTQKINNYLNENFPEQFTKQETITYNKKTNTEYAWDLSYANYVDAIVVHHTHSEYDDDLTGLKQIHKYHSLNRQWGDIGYHYVIGYDGVIYEGREGGDYVVGAHSTYNNIGTVGIAVLGNYESKGINPEQYSSLEQLIQSLTVKYGIDLSKKRYYHMNCAGSKCDNFPIENYLDSVLIGHRDATHTSCPGEKLYEQIQQIREQNIDFSSGFTPIKRGEKTSYRDNSSTSQIQVYLPILEKYSQDELQAIKKLIDIKLKQNLDTQMKKKLKTLRIAIILSIKN